MMLSVKGAFPYLKSCSRFLVHTVLSSDVPRYQLGGGRFDKLTNYCYIPGSQLKMISYL